MSAEGQVFCTLSRGSGDLELGCSAGLWEGGPCLSPDFSNLPHEVPVPTESEKSRWGWEFRLCSQLVPGVEGGTP